MSDGLIPPVPPGKEEEGTTIQGVRMPLEGGTGAEVDSPRSLPADSWTSWQRLWGLTPTLQPLRTPGGVWSATEVQSPVTAAQDSKSPTKDPESYGDNECYGQIPVSPHSVFPPEAQT